MAIRGSIYPQGGAIPLIDHTDILAQLSPLCSKSPDMLKLAHYVDATTTELGFPRLK